MRNTRLHQALLDRQYSAIIHITRRNAIRTGKRIVHRNLLDPLNRLRLIKRSVFIQHTAMAMAGVLAKANISHDEHLRELLLDGFDGEDDGAVGIGALRTGLIFGALGEGDAEEDDALETALDEGFEEGNDLVHSPPLLAGKGGDRGFLVRVISDEDWVDEHILEPLLRVSKLRIPAGVTGSSGE